MKKRAVKGDRTVLHKPQLFLTACPYIFGSSMWTLMRYTLLKFRILS